MRSFSKGNPSVIGARLPVCPDLVAAIDWTAPWLAPYLPVGQDMAAQVAAGVSSADALNGIQPRLRRAPPETRQRSLTFLNCLRRVTNSFEID